MEAESVSFLRDLWYCAGPGSLVRAGTMQHRTLLGEPILVGRDHSGRTFAMRDLCPHRGIPLSAGRLKRAVDGAGAMSEVECAYHGWRFGTDGGCRAIPSLAAGQDMEVSRIKVRSHPVIERQGLIWIFMEGETGRAVDNGEPPELPLIAPDAAPGFTEAMTFHCDVDHAVIGLMDPAHGPFVHRSWWWRSEASIHEKAKKFHPSPYGFTMTSHRPSSNSGAYKLLGGEVTTEISFRLPGLRTEVIRAARNFVVGFTTVTPVTAEQTEVRQSFFWNVPWLGLLRPFFRPFARQFLDQDRSMVDLQAEGLQYNPRLMLIDDADTQAKWYYRLKREWESARAEGRPFEHPLREETVLRWRS